MLVFVGLGLGEGGISLEGVEETRSADRAFAELYTNIHPDFKTENLEEKIGKEIEILNREDIEEDPGEILEASRKGKAVLMVQGDPMVATTHMDLRLRAKEEGIKTKIVHGASIETAAPGLSGLQSYKFGKTATIPFKEKPSETPYKVLEMNRKHGAHTLFLLDIERDKGRFLKANEALDQLLDLEKKLNKNLISENSLALVIARAGSSDPLVRGDRIKRLMDMDFGSPPHTIILPGSLHFLEEEALEKFAECPREVMNLHGKKKAE